MADNNSPVKRRRPLPFSLDTDIISEQENPLYDIRNLFSPSNINSSNSNTSRPIFSPLPTTDYNIDEETSPLKQINEIVQNTQPPFTYNKYIIFTYPLFILIVCPIGLCLVIPL